MEFYPDSKGGILGVMPDGETEQFSSEQEYEDAFWDRAFELENAFEVEMPEDYALA